MPSRSVSVKVGFLVTTPTSCPMFRSFLDRLLMLLYEVRSFHFSFSLSLRWGLEQERWVGIESFMSWTGNFLLIPWEQTEEFLVWYAVLLGRMARVNVINASDCPNKMDYVLYD